MEAIDKLDRRILYELDIAARQPVSSTAKKLGTSKQVVDYRVRRLEKRGIIKGYSAIIDQSKLGYFSIRVYIKLRNASPAKQQEMVGYATQQKDIWWTVSVDGDWDIDFVVLVKNIFQYYRIWEDYVSRYRKYIHRFESTIYSHIQEFPRSFFIGAKNEFPGIMINSSQEVVSLDDLDIRILQLLAKNARLETIRIAQQTGTDARTIAARIKSLEQKKVIAGYRTLIDLGKLGYQHYKVLLYLNSVSRVNEMKTWAMLHPNVPFINKNIGGADFELEIQVKNIEEFHEVLDDFKSQFHEDIDYLTYFRAVAEHKTIYYPS